ncbi:hypothetical protein J7E87_19970 [Streptomyces sp. ISL-1]|uniref:hypothetical protein n=1 Tax=Streptomyces sp. ISL-1 TaxID=2817657 RepID=UPI001BECA1EA|nr:hypothetical protein [Streptomyces sp. ISL-1]MBT2391648.1 hypothetical protein [Streptomyces sp. ISL-1]
MSEYTGPAAVIADGTRIEVEVELRSTQEYHETRAGGGRGHVPGLTSWGGRLSASGEPEAWAIQESDEPEIEIGNRVGKFITVGGDLGTGELTIKGSGPAPFGDD